MEIGYRSVYACTILLKYVSLLMLALSPKHCCAQVQPHRAGGLVWIKKSMSQSKIHLTQNADYTLLSILNVVTFSV